MDITRIMRYGRFLFPPVLTFLFGLVAIAVSQRTAAVSPLVDGLLKLFSFAALYCGLAACLAALAWFAWNSYRLARWEAGERDGDCHSCGAQMRQLDGQYGPYRVCSFCEAKREGWR